MIFFANKINFSFLNTYKIVKCPKKSKFIGYKFSFSEKSTTFAHTFRKYKFVEPF